MFMKKSTQLLWGGFLKQEAFLQTQQVSSLAGSVPIAIQGFTCFEHSGMLHDDGSTSCMQTLNTIKTSIIHCDNGVDDRIQGNNETINSCRVQGSFKLLISLRKPLLSLWSLWFREDGPWERAFLKNLHPPEMALLQQSNFWHYLST